MLADIGSSGPSFRDIFGGIGYIFGLMGVAAWFRYRH
jgi:nickel transport protein